MKTRFLTFALTLCLVGIAPGFAQPAAAPDPLVRLLISKGMLTESEAQALSDPGGNPANERLRLAALLRQKGLITQEEYDAIAKPAEPVLLASISAAGLGAVPARGQAPRTQGATLAPPAPQPTGPAVIPAIIPIRLLPAEPVKREGLIPDIKLGSGIRLKPYGFAKASLIYDTSSPGGNDFPLPGFINDTGPDLSPEFHAKARSARLGLQLEGLDPSPNWAITARFEADFEGNFSRVNNRNISTIRSSMFSIRTAYLRSDYKFSDKTSAFMLFGQDWTPFASSTLPNVVETTGLGLAFGTLYERAAQARFGFTRSLGGARQFKITPEFAIVNPAYGNVPADVGNQLGFGERQGADSARPEAQGRLVFQWQLDKAAAVPPAQVIFSFMQGSRKAIVPAANVPAAFKAAFPNGAQASSGRYGYTAETQLPTRFFTLLTKYYNGQDLRFYFAGQLYSNFNDTAGLTGVATGPSIDASANVAFGLRDGTPAVAPQRPVRSEGGFVNLAFPLSRIFEANPSGRNSGWSAYLHYGFDAAYAHDARRIAGGRGHSDWSEVGFNYKLNSFTTFLYAESLFRTQAVNNSVANPGGLPLLRGIPSRQWKDIRSEFSTLFTF